MFKKTLLGLALVATAGAANAATSTYGWEDGGAVLGTFGNIGSVTNVASGVNGAPTAWEGNAMLHIVENPIGGTPQALVGMVTGLSEGDEVTASFYGYDTTPGTFPSLRIWGHYGDSATLLSELATNGEITDFTGSAGGNSTYTDGTGWNQVSHTWTIAAGQDGLVIEARIYSAAGANEAWVDGLSITAPDGALITTPAPVPVPAAVWLMGSAVAGLAGFARRRKA